MHPRRDHLGDDSLVRNARISKDVITIGTSTSITSARLNAGSLGQTQISQAPARFQSVHKGGSLRARPRQPRLGGHPPQGPTHLRQRRPARAQRLADALQRPLAARRHHGTARA
ncbi:unnamed protein product [Prorocentrum cordatum]|uniref:Uncharacterized protein n=1 Tax=Prorocentrum cordatum TaxID=2364126 RepID=A0ABN9P7Q8_9DINO|nr:unnamed protein product [Polarella glacialis]